MEIKNLSKTARETYQEYKPNITRKDHENLFVLGFEACGLRHIWGDKNVSLHPQNLAHSEINGDCCGIFNAVNKERIVVCNECGITIPVALGYRENYCMPDGINSKEEHAQYLRDIGITEKPALTNNEGKQ